jgi:hypothetical protein
MQAVANDPQLIESCTGIGCGQCAAAPSSVPNPPLPPARAGLRAPPVPSPSPPLGFVQRILGRSGVQSAQQKQQAEQHKEQFLEERTATGYSVLQIRVFHFFVAMLVLFSLLAARLACKAGSRARPGGGAEELTPLTWRTAGGALGRAPPRAAGGSLPARAGFTRVAPVG